MFILAVLYGTRNNLTLVRVAPFKVIFTFFVDDACDAKLVFIENKLFSTCKIQTSFFKPKPP
jgi:hypothetical protein